jgi:hypothetical protein
MHQDPGIEGCSERMLTLIQRTITFRSPKRQTTKHKLQRQNIQQQAQEQKIRDSPAGSVKDPAAWSPIGFF